MTIKETEQLTGMPRASIRFYEAEGLICPQREKNGYRIYEQEDVDALLRIRLLRTLGVSLEELRELTEGSLMLADCLLQHTAQLETDRENAGRAAEICRQLAAETVEFRGLDAGRWIALLETARPVAMPERNLSPKPGLLRRFLARGVDITLYVLAWELLLVLLFRANLAEGVTKASSLLMQWLEGFAVMACMLLFEPLFLCHWGTTPGKWLLGICVTDNKGAKLRYRDAAKRCGTLAVYGYGLNIPVLSVVRQVKCMLDVRRGEEPEWEWDSRLLLQAKGRLRAGFLLAAFACAAVAAETEIQKIPEIPPHGGTLTTAEFAENFNALQEYYDKGTNNYIVSGDMRELTAGLPWALDTDGRWVSRDDERFYAWVYQGDPPAITLHTDESGAVVGVTLSLYAEWETGSDSDTARRGRNFTREIFLMRVVLQAFGGAQRSNRLPFSGWRAVQDISANGWRQDYSLVYKNVAVDYDVEFSGCAPAKNGGPRLEETTGTEKCAVSYTFSVYMHETPGRILV